VKFVRTFLLLLIACQAAIFGAAPIISDIHDQYTAVDTVTPAIAFTIDDPDTPVLSLVLTAISSNPVVVPNANIILSGSGHNHAITILPGVGAVGSASITVSVSDGTLTASDSFILTVTPLPGTVGTNEAVQARIQATNSLIKFKALITPGNFKALGFFSTNEVLQATNAEPIFVYPVILDRLRNFQAGQDLQVLLGAMERALVPTMVETNVRSSLMLRLASTGIPARWTNEDWGRPELAQDLVGAYRIIPAGQIVAGTIPFAVHLSVLNIWFVGFRTASGTVFRATRDIPPLTLQSNQIVSVSTITNLAAILTRYPGPP